MKSKRRRHFDSYNFAVVVVQHPDGRFLAVREVGGRGWWLPAGFVDPGESFAQSALRETREEAGIEVRLEGILRIEHSLIGTWRARMRVVYYARPLDETPPKTVPDRESEEARWVTIPEIEALARSFPGLRGPELLMWARYLDGGGEVSPLKFLGTEFDPPNASTGPSGGGPNAII